MDQNFRKSNADLANQAVPPMAQCEISGEWVPADELVTFQGKRVSAAGKRMLLDRLSSGELPSGAAVEIVAIARAQRKLLRLVLISIAGGLSAALIAAMHLPGVTAIIFVAAIGYLVLGVSYLLALYRLARACGSRWAWLYVVTQFMSFIGLIALVILISKSNRMLRDAGLKVGLMGVKKSEIDAMENASPR